MKKHLISFIAVFLALIIAAPCFSSVISLAAEESEDDIWTTMEPAYMDADFTDIADRIAGDATIEPMKLHLILHGYAIYTDALTGEMVCLKLEEPDAEGKYPVDDNGVYKYTGYYSTNPYSVGQSGLSAEKKTVPEVKKTLLSQIILKYTENEKETTFNSYTNSARNEQITIKDIRNGVRVEYTLGREESKYLVPLKIRVDKWYDLLLQILRSDVKWKETKTFCSYYILQAKDAEQITHNFEPSDLTEDEYFVFFATKKEINDDKERDGVFGISAGLITSAKIAVSEKTEKAKAEIVFKNPVVEKMAIMVIDSTIQRAQRAKLEITVKQGTNYSYEQMSEDHNEAEYEGTNKIPALFKLAIEYSIDEYGLNIRLNAGNIRFDNANYKLKSIEFLPYAGAGSTFNDGYIFYPDGSGTLIDLKSVQGKQFTIINPIYGQDYVYHEVTGGNRNDIRFPAFGIIENEVYQETYIDTTIEIDENGDEIIVETEKTRDVQVPHGYLAVVTDGESLTKLAVNSGGATHMYASAYTIYTPRQSDTYVLNGALSVSGDAVWTVESKRKYTGDYRMRIFILDEDNASYSGMANVYREYLEATGVLVKQEKNNEDIPLYIRTLGALDHYKLVLGVPFDTVEPLTTFAKTIKMIEELKQKGITNIKIHMQGWVNDGLEYTVPAGVDVVKELGGSKGFQELVDYANANGVTLYPEFDFARAMKDKLFDNFNVKKDLVKTIDDRFAMYQYWDPVFQSYSYNGTGVISPRVMEKFYNMTYEEYKQYNVGGIAVSSLGKYLSSDFNEDNPLHREDSKKLTNKLLGRIYEDNSNVLVSGGNAYTLEYVTDIVNFPTEDSGYKYSTASVPFYAMVLHGYKEYTAITINSEGNKQRAMLKSLENGAYPYFTVAIENTYLLKNYAYWSEFFDVYSVKYSILLKSILEIYNEMNSVLKKVIGSKIINHEFVDNNNDIVKVTYDNGTVFFINYSLKDYKVNYNSEIITVPAEDYYITASK